MNRVSETSETLLLICEWCVLDIPPAAEATALGEFAANGGQPE